MTVLGSLFLAAPVFCALVMSGCAHDSPMSPSSSSIVTFDVQGQTFRALLTSAEQVAAAQAAQAIWGRPLLSVDGLDRSD